VQKLVETRTLEIDAKVTGGVKLPRAVILYTVDAEHFVLAAEPLKALEEGALTKTRVAVVTRQGKNVIKLPLKVYNFYHLDECDYTIMASDKDPGTVIIRV